MQAQPCTCLTTDLRRPSEEGGSSASCHGKVFLRLRCGSGGSATRSLVSALRKLSACACCRRCRRGAGCSRWCPGKDGDSSAPAICVPSPARSRAPERCSCQPAVQTSFPLPAALPEFYAGFAQSGGCVRDQIPLGSDVYGP